MKYRRSNPHGAAIAIQAAYRGYSVRRTHPLKHLRVIRNVRGELQKLEHELATDPKVVEAMRQDPAERLRWSEGGMALLLQLDSMQGVHPVVREHRKALNKDVTMFQEYIDSAGAKGAHVPYVQSSLRRQRRSSRRDPSPPPQLYHYCATGWMPHTPYVGGPVPPGRRPGEQPPAQDSYYPPQRDNSYRPPQQGPSQQENSYRPSQQENSYYPPQGPPPGTHQHSRTSSSSYGHPGVNPNAHMAYVPTVPGERPVGHFPPEPETTYHPPQAPGPPHGAHQSSASSYPSYVNPHAHMAYVPTVPGERPVGHFPPESETTHYPPQAAGPSHGTHQYNGTTYSSYPPQPPVNPYAHMAYVPTVPGERPVGHFPVDPETTYPPPQAPGPPRGTNQYNNSATSHSSNAQQPAVNNPYAHIPSVSTVPGDRRERPSEPERPMYYPPQQQGWGLEQNYGREYR